MNNLSIEIRESVVKQLRVDNIQNPLLRDWVKNTLITYVKDEFFLQPASMSGRYHPSSDLGIGGLVKHTENCLCIAEELFRIYNFNPEERDLIRATLTLHDIAKPGSLHPIEASAYFAPCSPSLTQDVEKIILLISSHMGQWDVGGKLPTPVDKTQFFVHLCDYISSRDIISINTKEIKL